MVNANERRRQNADREATNDEAKSIALDYLYYRLSKSGYTWHSCPHLPDPQRVQLIMRELGDEFEQRYAMQFNDMSALLDASLSTTYPNFAKVCDGLFSGENYYQDVENRIEIKWSRIVAMYAFGGLLAVECIRNNLEWKLPYIADWIYIYVRQRLSYWICHQGGWDGLIEFYESRNPSWDPLKTLLTTAGAVCGVAALGFMIAKHL